MVSDHHTGASRELPSSWNEALPHTELVLQLLSSHPRRDRDFVLFFPLKLSIIPLRIQTDYFFFHRMLKHIFPQPSQNNSFLGMNASITVFKQKISQLAKYREKQLRGY